MRRKQEQGRLGDVKEIIQRFDAAEITRKIGQGNIQLMEHFGEYSFWVFAVWEARAIEGGEVDNVTRCQGARIAQAVVERDETMSVHKYGGRPCAKGGLRI